MNDVVILGAGITGLAAGHAAREQGLQAVLLERDERSGGKIGTRCEDGFLFELGPNSVQASDLFLELCRVAGCADRLVDASPKAKRRWIVHRGRLSELPGDPAHLFSTPLLGAAAKLRLLREPMQRRGPGPHESVADFARRRFGKGTLHLVDAMISGIYAGDPEELAVGYAFPALHKLEQEKGSVLRGAIAAAREAKKKRGREKAKAPKPKRRLISFPGGLGRLVEALAEPLDVCYGHDVAAVEQHPEGGFVVRGSRPGDEPFEIRAQQVVSALPAQPTMKTLAPLGETEAFGTVPHASIAVVGLGYRASEIPHPINGFGFLAPFSEKRNILGCLFSSSLFPDRAPNGCAALTVMVGGRRRPDLVELDDEELITTARRDLSAMLGARAKPSVRTIMRWRGGAGIAQATADAGQVIAAADALERGRPGLKILGEWVRGIGLPKCVEAGWTAFGS